MQYSVPVLSIVSMSIVALIGIAIPLALFIVFRKRCKADILPFLIGMAVFVVFALVLEGTVNSFLFSSSAGISIKSNIWSYGMVGGLMAGLFEESGRFIAFKTVLRKKRGNDMNALMYGAGHGGFEAFYMLFFGMISYISMAVMLNNGTSGQLASAVTGTAAQQSLNATFQALATTPPQMYLLSVVERIAAVTFHICCSVLVWFAAKNRKQLWLYPLALLLHAALDALAVIMASYVPNVLIIEAVIYGYTALCVVFTVFIWKKYAADKGASTEVNTAAEA